MSKEPLKHYAPENYTRGNQTATACNRMVSTADTVADPRDATCKLCLTHVTEKSKREMCAGCEDNFYNGNNQLGVKECWNLPKARIVSMKKIGINDVPPWKDQSVIRMLSCRREKGYVFRDPKKEY